VPLPIPIPDGTPDQPGGTNLFAFVTEPDFVIQRAYVTNRIYHEEAGDLIGIINHTDISADGGGADASVTLNNHRTWNGYENPDSPYNIIYDDSDQGDLDTFVPTPIPTDGPGSLQDFVGQQAMGVWQYTISDNALFHTGVVEELTLVLQPASTNAGDAVNLTATIGPNKWLYAGFRVPADATNVEICAYYDPPGGPIDVFVRRDFRPTLTQYDKATNNVLSPGACMEYGLDDQPPLNAGRYFVGVYNESVSSPVTVHLIVTVQRGLVPDRTVTTPNDNLTMIIDDATTNSTIIVTNRGIITSVEVDVRLDHPRIADLSLHLVSPGGTRLLLAENRGRDITNGYGVSVSNYVVTNFMGRVLDDGFEYARGTGNGPVYQVGSIISGWTVDHNDIDVVHDTYGLGGPSHTGTNAIDLVGNVGPGGVWTNVATTVGKTYLLSFAFCRNPDGLAPPSQEAQVEVNSNLAFRFTYAAPNSRPNMMWSNISYAFQATQSLTRVGFRQFNPASPAIPGGMFIDTVRMDEVEIITNSLLYATFTDDPLKALLPIKFAPPPFGDTNFVSTNVFISGFEDTNFGIFSYPLYTNANLFTNTESYDGWLVTTNRVYVQTNNALAYSDTNYLFVRTGSVARVLSNTVEGKEYVLQFATRTARKEIYSTGVDVDDVPLDFGEVDSHYTVFSNTVSCLSKALSFVLFTNSMDLSWFEPTNGPSRWIGITNTTPPGTNVPSGFFGYRTTFDLTDYQTNTAVIQGRFAADDEIMAVLLNGQDTGIIPPGGNASGFTDFTIVNTATAPFLQRGNRLEFVVTNNPAVPNGPTAHGLRVEFEPVGITAQLRTNKDGTYLPGHLYYSIGEVRLAGCCTNYFNAFSDEWRMQNVTFVARSNNVLLQFTGITPGVWLDHVQIRETGRKYYFPEEPLTPLVGQQAFGAWKLELWDNRLAQPVGDTNLISWRLNINYVRTNPPFVRLANNVAFQGRIPTNSVRYFAFDVPCDTGTVTNALVSLTTSNLDLLFNQNTFPLTGAFGDYLLLNNITNDTNYLDVGTAPLFRSGRYFLAVRSTNTTPVDFILTVGMDPCAPVPAPLVGPIGKPRFSAGAFSFQWSASPNDQFSVQYANNPAGPWTELPQAITSDTGNFSFTDNGSQTGGLPPHRFYRFRRR